MGRVPMQIDYSGREDAYKWTFGWVSGREDYTLTEVQANVPVDPAKFAKPRPMRR